MRLLFLLPLFLLLLPTSTTDTVNEEAGEVLSVSSGAEFVQAVQDFGKQGGEWTISLDATSPISLLNVSWTDQDDLKPGTLTIQGRSSPPGSVAILDTAMRSGLTPVLSEVTVTWQSVVLTNLCSRMITWNPSDALFVLNADSMFLMPRSWSVQSVVREDLISYMTYREFIGTINILILSSAPFAKIQNGWVQATLARAPNRTPVIDSMDDYSITFKYFETSGSINRNVTFRATNNPADPLGLKLPEVGGSLMPHRLCANDGTDTGPLLSRAEVHEANYTFFPTWIVSSTPQLRTSLVEVSNQGLTVINVRDQSPPQIVVILRDVSIAEERGAAPNSVLFRTDVLLHGPMTAERATLNMADISGAIRLSPSASLFIENLVLTELKSTVVSKSMVQNTSLHLVAFTRPDSEMVHLSNVTLLVPKQDFIALLSAAHRGSRWQSGAGSSADLIEQISVFKPRHFDRASLLLSEYKGWNVEGINVIFMPNTPLLSSDKLFDQDVNGSDAYQVALGMGVGVGVGGGLLLIGALLAVVVIHKRRKGRSYEGAVDSNQSKDTEQAMQEGTYCYNSRKGINNNTSSGGDSAATAETRIMSEGDYVAIDMLQNEIVVDEKGMPLQKIAADQVESVNAPLDLHALVRQQAAALVKSNNEEMLKLDRVLGKGAWGTVYKGTWKGLTVAVKTVLFSEHTGCASRLPEKARAIMEAAVCTSISHPNVVSTYYYDILPVFHGHGNGKGLQVSKSANAAEDWKLFLVLEFCHSTLGHALKSDFLHRGYQPIWDRILQLLFEVAQGTLYLHNLQIIHGDLKPENILLKIDPDATVGVVAKITDFGLAMSLGPTATHVSDFRSGTPFYCAPEVATQGRTTKASDVFSFGVVMCEVCSKTAPWVKQGNDYSVNTQFPRFPPETPAVFRQLALRCLALDMHERPKFEEIVSSLKSMMEDLGAHNS